MTTFNYRSVVFLALLVGLMSIGSNAAVQASEPWQITTQAVEGSPGWFTIKMWAKNVSGIDMESCACQLTVSENGESQPHSQGWISLGDADNGQTLYYEFNVYSQRGFNYTVKIVGYPKGSRPR